MLRKVGLIIIMMSLLIGKLLFLPTVKRSHKGSSVGEEEGKVLDLQKLHSSMGAAVNALKWEYSNSLITRVTPGMAGCDS